MGINECAFGRTADEVYCDIYQKLEKFGQVAFKASINSMVFSFIVFISSIVFSFMPLNKSGYTGQDTVL